MCEHCNLGLTESSAKNVSIKKELIIDLYTVYTDLRQAGK